MERMQEGRLRAMDTDEKRDVSPIELINEDLEKKNKELMRKVQEIIKEKQESQAQWQQEKEGYETNLAELRKKLLKLTNKYTMMEEKYHRIEPAYNFYHAFGVILPNDGSNIYHRYGCKKLNLDRIFIYNIGQVKSRSDLKPCPFCFQNGKTES